MAAVIMTIAECDVCLLAARAVFIDAVESGDYDAVQAADAELNRLFDIRLHLPQQRTC